MSSAETWRAHAKSAATLLAELASEEDREFLLALARGWLKNAEELDEQVKPRPGREIPRGVGQLRGENSRTVRL